MQASYYCASVTSPRFRSLMQVLRRTVLVTGIGVTSLGLIWLSGELSLARTLAAKGVNSYFDSSGDCYITPQPVNAAAFVIAGLSAMTLALSGRRTTSRASASMPARVLRAPHAQPAEALGLV